LKGGTNNRNLCARVVDKIAPVLNFSAESDCGIAVPGHLHLSLVVEIYSCGCVAVALISFVMNPLVDYRANMGNDFSCRSLLQNQSTVG
jgi:hypothetical protein